MTNQPLTHRPFHAYLFVPASQPKRILKALTDPQITHQTHAIIIDLEDAVAGLDACQVRDVLGQYLLEVKDQLTEQSPQIWVRIHGTAHHEFMADARFVALQPLVAGVVSPKAATSEQVSLAHECTARPLFAMIESAQRVLNIGQMARTKGVMALSYGCLDLLASLSIKRRSLAGAAMMDRVRCELVLHSQANGLYPPIETIYPEFHDEDGFGKWVHHAHEFGFGGCLAIHPKQLSIIHGIGIRADELDFAKKIVAHHSRTGEAVFAIDGQMVDLPVIEWARRILAE